MFKKKDKDGAEDKTTRKVVTETVEKRGGVQTTTTTISCTKDDFDTAFHKLNLDPEKFKSGGTSVTRQIIYTNSAGQKEVFEETVETYGDSKPTIQQLDETKTVVSEARSKDSDKKDGKSITERLGFSFGKIPKDKENKDKLISDKIENERREVTPGKFKDECLRKHNEYRRKHGVPDLSLSDAICAYSKEWADHLAATDSFKHRTERKYGENIYMKWSSDPNHMVTGEEAVDSWYSEIKDHTFGQEPRSLKSGHFTQVIWKDSKQLGVAWARSKSGKILVVANYDPSGNFIGNFADNVPPPKK